MTTHDGLGGPQHYPVIIPAPVFRDCAEDSCDHALEGEECPTYEAIACATCPVEEGLLGPVGFSQAWPCPASLAEDAKAAQS